MALDAAARDVLRREGKRVAAAERDLIALARDRAGTAAADRP